MSRLSDGRSLSAAVLRCAAQSASPCFDGSQPRSIHPRRQPPSGDEAPAPPAPPHHCRPLRPRRFASRRRRCPRFARRPKFSGALVGSLLAFALIVLLLRTDTELIVRLLGSLQMLGPVLAFTILSTVMGKTAGTLSFDEVSAQVLIVLLLALAVDARFFRLRPGQDRLDVIVVLYTMLLLAVGEFLALKGLLTSHPVRAEMIAGAIAAGFTAVAIAALTGADQDQAEADSPSTP